MMKTTTRHEFPQWSVAAIAALFHRPQFELYTLDVDPVETPNLAGDEAHAQTLRALQARLRHYQQTTADPLDPQVGPRIALRRGAILRQTTDCMRSLDGSTTQETFG
jgi:hypothetical protein